MVLIKILVMFFMSSACVFAESAPRDTGPVLVSRTEVPAGRSTKDKCRVKLPEGVKEAITKYNPAFHPYAVRDYDAQMLTHYKFTSKSCPSIVIGDFNGDGIPDAFFEGYAGDMYIVLVVLSNSNEEYMVHEIWKRDQNKTPEAEFVHGNWIHMYKLVPKGTSFDCGGDESSNIKKLPVDGVATETFGSIRNYNSTNKILILGEIDIWDITMNKWYQWCAPYDE